MIAQLRGTVARVAGSFVILDVHGVGYKVFVPVTVLESLPEDKNEAVTLVTHLQVREDDLSLFGFTDDIELRAFELLLTVSGVGPKVALALLSALTAGDLASAIASDDVRTLTRVPGIGAKTAQRMVLELREKFAALGFEQRMDKATSQKAAPKDSNALLLDDAVSALMNLGYTKPEAMQASSGALDEQLKSEGATPPSLSGLLKASLNRLNRNR